MLITDKWQVEQEVRRYLAQTRGSYRRLLDAIVGELEDFRDRGNNRERIYRIYTRADKQVGGDALKSEARIATKLRKWRLDPPEEGGETRIWRVRDIHDIIGLTVVTYFNSGAGVICEALQRPDAFRTFKVLEATRKFEKGYYATHLIVEGRGVGRGQLKCEIQVKTLLHDGWATRTHDLTYKAAQAISPEIQEMVEVMGGMVQSLERQSDSLRGLILDGSERDRERRTSAVKQLMLGQEHYANEGDAELVELFRALDAQTSHLTDCSEVDPLLVDLTERWQALVASRGPSRGRCRFIVALAAQRVDRDLDMRALEAVDAYEEKAEPPEAEQALAFRSLAHWVLGDFDEAEAAGNRLIDIQEQANHGSAQAYLDLAYYLAEKLYLSASQDETRERAKIDELVQRAPQPTSDRIRMSAQDTRGAIKIMTATDVQMVTEGMRLCNDAYTWSIANKADVRLFELFYDHHLQRGRRQLRRLTS